jgi:hypothetical protein
MSPQDLALLANVLPDFSRQYQLQVYQGVLQECLSAGNVESSCSLEVLYQLRQQLGLSQADHCTVLAILGIEQTDRLDPEQQRSRENQARLQDYQQALELILLELVDGGMPLQASLQRRYPQILVLQKNCQITDREHAQILDNLLTDQQRLFQKAEMLLSQLAELTRHPHRSSRLPLGHRRSNARSAPTQQQVVTQLLSILEILGEDPSAIVIADRVSQLASHVIPGLLARSEQNASWQTRISPNVMAALRPEPVAPYQHQVQRPMVSSN